MSKCINCLHYKACYANCKSIGKTVFFDREEAEKALEGMKEDG